MVFGKYKEFELKVSITDFNGKISDRDFRSKRSFDEIGKYKVLV